MFSGRGIGIGITSISIPFRVILVHHIAVCVLYSHCLIESTLLSGHGEYEQLNFVEAMCLVLVLAILVQIGHTVPSAHRLLNVREHGLRVIAVAIKPLVEILYDPD